LIKRTTGRRKWQLRLEKPKRKNGMFVIASLLHEMQTSKKSEIVGADGQHAVGKQPQTGA
jgi:hypothetical protein